MNKLQVLSLSLAIALGTSSLSPALANGNSNSNNNRHNNRHNNSPEANAHQKQGQGQLQGQQQGQKAYGGDADATGVGIGLGVGKGGDADATAKSKSNAEVNDHSIDVNANKNVNDNTQNLTNKNANIGIQGQKTDVDTDVRNANLGVNKQGDQTQLGIQGQKNTQLGVQEQDASTKSGNINLIDASHSDHSVYDGRSEAIVYPDQIMGNPSNGTTITTQSLICTPDGKHTVLTDSTTVPEHRVAFGLGVNVSFVGGGFINFQNAGRLHKSQVPHVQAAVKGVHEQRIARLSQVGGNPLAQTMMKWNMADRAMVGISGKDKVEAAKAQALTEFEAYRTFVADGGDPSLLNCTGASLPPAPEAVYIPTPSTSSSLPTKPIKGLY